MSRRPPLALVIGLGIIAVAIVVLVLRHDAGSVAGLSTDRFARLAQLAAVLVLIGAGTVAARGRLAPRLFALLIWAAAGAALVAGYALINE